MILLLQIPLVFYEARSQQKPRKPLLWAWSSFWAFVPNGIALSLKASFYAIAIPLCTTTIVVQAHRRKNPANAKKPLRINDETPIYRNGQRVVHKMFSLFFFSHVAIPQGWWCGCRLLSMSLLISGSMQTWHQRRSLNMGKGFSRFLLILRLFSLFIILYSLYFRHIVPLSLSLITFYIKCSVYQHFNRW